jgi:branched-chain amino acid transport system permease protein
MLVLQTIVNGLLIGGIYALVAVGFSLIWGVANIINLTHGVFVLLGAYISFWLFKLYHIDPFLSIPVSMVLLFFLGFFIEKYLLNYVIRAGVFMTLILTFGLARIFENQMVVAWTGDWRAITTAYSGAGLMIGGVSIPYIRLAVFALALLFCIALSIFLNKTKVGMAIRALTFNVEGAIIVGINVGQIYTLTLAISAAMAGAAGSLISTIYSFSPFLGTPYLSWSFVIVVLGGLGSIYGAVVGGILLGLIESFSVLLVGPGYQVAIGFIILVIFLIVRPQGLFGKKFLT